MILIFTDFGTQGPYLGQVKAVLAAAAPGVPVVDLMVDAPRCDPKASAYLLAALLPGMPDGSVCLAVVDPGVGTEQRLPVAVRLDRLWLVGPDNGLFDIAARRATRASRREILWRPARLSRSFHGRDLFAPVAAMIARGETPAGVELGAGGSAHQSWPDDLSEVVYVDAFGNAMTGLRRERVADTARVRAGARVLCRAATFGEVGVGEAFWYANSLGLVEIAVNRGSAAAVLGLAIGDPVEILPA